MFRQYAEFCKSRPIPIGQLWIYRPRSQVILNFPTKKHWRNPSKLEYIGAGLQKLPELLRQESQAYLFPQLGCGNGAWTGARCVLSWSATSRGWRSRVLHQAERPTDFVPGT